MKVFVTYGDGCFEAAKARIVKEARQTGEFDMVLAYGREDLSEELLASDIIKERRGGGLWSWKPDVLLTTMKRCQDGDTLVYCDAGCSVYPSKEWQRIWHKLECHDLIAQRIFQRTDHWTRRELLEAFAGDCGLGWPKCYQYQATIILNISSFTRRLVSEWRKLMITKPVFALDVTEDERTKQHASFIENRHDQAVYSALVYKYLHGPNTHNRIYTQWEHIEDFDIIRPQAIRATRLRQGETETSAHRRKAIVKRLIKDYVYKPLRYAPLQWWYSRK